MTNIATAAITPIMGSLHNNSMVGSNNNNATRNTSTALPSMNGKQVDDDDSTRNKSCSFANIILKMDKGPQQMVVSPPSPSISQKGSIYPNDAEQPGSNVMVNNNYITASSPNSGLGRGHGMTATQLTGVKHWWKNQMEYFSSDEEW